MVEYQYDLSSLPPDAAHLGDLIRAYWLVESERSKDSRRQNQYHHVLDVT